MFYYHAIILKELNYLRTICSYSRCNIHTVPSTTWIRHSTLEERKVRVTIAGDVSSSSAGDETTDSNIDFPRPALTSNMELYQRSGGMHLSVWLLAVVVFASISHTESITDSEKTAIQLGLETGKELLDVIKDKEFTKALTKIAGSIGPFLGVLGPFASLIMVFIPTGDSAELAFMKEMMKKIDNRFDQVDSRFDDIERLIDWVAVAVSFGQIEQKIMAMSDEYRLFYASDAPASNKSYVFKMHYENDYQNSGSKLYHAIVNKQGKFQENLGESIMRYTINDRKKTQDFLLGVMRLLLQAVKIDITYYTLQGFEKIAEERTDDWKEKILKVNSNYKEIDDAVRGKYFDQSEIDIKKLSADNYGVSNEQFHSLLYDMLSQKYYWIDWFVVVYNPITGSEKHQTSTCSGHILFRQDGRNILASGRYKTSPKMGEIVKTLKETAITFATQFFIVNELNSAQVAYNAIIKVVKPVCSLSVIWSDADVWYKGDPTRVIYYDFKYMRHSRYDILVFD
ncbi:unnamed protein product [Owenia fusiformis]|uniref:Uncharacterized protein n=1 Tax=Owenia fusiformis TaxID=6347 RepID=A0A8S4Q989_OWEFU|nr:unnamed protein product [Owenia fusiformis]